MSSKLDVAFSIHLLNLNTLDHVETKVIRRTSEQADDNSYRFTIKSTERTITLESVSDNSNSIHNLEGKTTRILVGGNNIPEYFVPRPPRIRH